MESVAVKRSCTRCGGPLPPESRTAVCPRCLLGAALDSDTDAHATRPVAVLPDTASAPGEFALGSHEILGEIARGGMGVVVRARQRGLNRVVALKFIAGGKFAGPEFEARFRIEAESAARLSHPNIVAIHEVGVSDGRPYFSMEFVDGPNLAAWREGRHLTADACAALLHTLAGAVHFAHQRGVLHRDLKPQNILMDSTGVPHITDFGLAKQLERETETLTLTGTGFGSPGYAAPEQAGGQRARTGPASDVYSLGAILYFLLTGAAPHSATTALETFRRALEEQPVPPSKLNPQTPRDLETICLKCLEKEPQRRYATARELAADLDRFLQRLPLEARRAGVLWKSWIWARSRPWTITGLASLLQLAMIGLAYGLWQQTQLLQWRLDHPGLPVPGGVQLIHSPAAASLLIFICMIGGYLPLKDLRVRLAGGRSIERGDVVRFSLVGAAFAGIGIWLLLRCIEGFIWHHENTWRLPGLALLAPFSFFWFGSIIVLKALRGHHAERHATDVLAAQRGSPIRTPPLSFLLTLLAAVGTTTPLLWAWLGAQTGHAALYLLTNIFLLLLAAAFSRAARDEMKPFWLFLIVAALALALELAAPLSAAPIAAALGLGTTAAALVIRRARIGARPSP